MSTRNDAPAFGGRKMRVHAQHALHARHIARRLLGRKRRLAAVQQLQHVRRNAIQVARPQRQRQVPLRHGRRPRRLNVPQEGQQPLLNRRALRGVVCQADSAGNAGHDVGHLALGLAFEDGHDEFGLPRLMVGFLERRVVEEPDNVALGDGLGKGVPGGDAVEHAADGELLRKGGVGVDELVLDLVEFAVSSCSELHLVGYLGGNKAQILVVHFE